MYITYLDIWMYNCSSSQFHETDIQIRRIVSSSGLDPEMAYLEETFISPDR